jgi:alanyl-tRNA synthetase
VAAVLKVPVDEVHDRVETLSKEVRQLRKQLATTGPKGEGVSVERLIEQAADLGGVKVVIAEVSGGPNDLRQLIDQIRRKAAPVAVMLGNRQDEESKVMLIAGLSRDLVDRGLDAVAWVRSAAGIVGGSGGGRPDMAQAGGKQPEKLPAAFAAARGEIEKLLSG